MSRDQQELRVTERSLTDAITAWVVCTDDQERRSALEGLMHACAAATVRTLRLRDAAAAAQLAATLIPLRAALKDWPAAAMLPPYNALLGSFQAMLRNETAQLDRLRAKLDAHSAAMLAAVEQQSAGTDGAARSPAGDRIETIRQRITEAMPAALRADPPQRVRLIARLEQLIGQAHSQAGSSAAVLTPFLHACVALLRDEPVSEDGLAPEDRHQVAAWLAYKRASFELRRNGRLPEPVVAALLAGDAMALDRALTSIPADARASAVAELHQLLQQHRMPDNQRDGEAYKHVLRNHHIASVADRVQELAAQTLREGDDQARRNLAVTLTALVEHFARGERPGSPYADLAAFLQAVVAQLWDEPVPPVPPAYAESIAALQRVRQGRG